MLRAPGVKVGVLETIEEKALKKAEAESEMKTTWKDIDGETESEIWRVLEPLGVFVNIYTPYMMLWLTNTTDERVTSVLKETPALYGYLVTQEGIAFERLRATDAKKAGDQLRDSHESNVKEIGSWFKGYRDCLQALKQDARRVLYLDNETTGASNYIRKFHATHAPVSEWREDILCSRLDELNKAASLSIMDWDALGDCRIVLKEAGDTECEQCQEAVLRWPVLARLLGYSEFPNYVNFWNEEKPENYNIRLSAINQFEEKLASKAADSKVKSSCGLHEVVEILVTKVRNQPRGITDHESDRQKKAVMAGYQSG